MIEFLEGAALVWQPLYYVAGVVFFIVATAEIWRTR